jgi:pimeloyl-ACP methyl ester carboxylesterase
MAQAQEKGCARIGDIQMFYATFGNGEPVLLIHGGLGNAEIWEAQVAALSARFKVIVADSRGHGRSTRAPGRGFHYREMADDYVALLDRLGIARVALIGWSDGAIIGLDIAMRHPHRLSRLFAHAGNTDPSGLRASPGAAWAGYERWAREAYRRQSADRCGGPGRDDYIALKAALRPMWGREPRWTIGDLAKISLPTAVVLGERDEAIRCDHTRGMVAAIPKATLTVLPGVGHFAMRQDARAYNRALLSFLEGDPIPGGGTCR